MKFSDTENVTLCHSGKNGFDTGKSPPKRKDPSRSNSALSEQSMEGPRSPDKRLMINEMLDTTIDSDDLARTMPRSERGPSLLFPEPSTYVGGPADEELQAFDASVAAAARISSPTNRPGSRGSGGARAQSAHARGWAAGATSPAARSSHSARG
jgi:hypothetical protein